MAFPYLSARPKRWGQGEWVTLVFSVVCLFLSLLTRDKRTLTGECRVLGKSSLMWKGMCDGADPAKEWLASVAIWGLVEFVFWSDVCLDGTSM